MRINRKDNTLNEYIDWLDAVYVKANGDANAAFGRLGPQEFEFIEKEVSRCARDPRYYLENYHAIDALEYGIKSLYPFNEPQEIFYAVVETFWVSGQPVRVIALKARQVGTSTICQGLVFHKTIFADVCATIVVAQDKVTSGRLLKMSSLAYEYLPWWMRPEKRFDAKDKYLHFDRNDDAQRIADPGLRSKLEVYPANKITGVGRGATFRCGHMCLSASNPVILRDSFLSSIADIAAGVKIRGPRGMVDVSAWSARPEENGYRVTAWCNSAFPVEGTANHEVEAVELYTGHGGKIKTRNRRLVRLDELSKSDSFVVPVRPITASGTLQLAKADYQHRPQGGGSVPKWTTPTASREFGLAVGLYLAEGSLTKNGLVLTLDRDETDLAKRFSHAVGVPYGKVGTRRDSRTTHFCFYNGAMVEWFRRVLGEKDGKLVADEFWTLGRDFLAGVLEGLILGDGHISKMQSCIYFSTVRPQLAIAFRELAMSLGHGYGGIHRRAAGFHSGRNCREMWTVVLTDQANRAIRSEYGWLESAPTAKVKGRHWYYSGDKSEMFVRLRLIEKVPLDLVYDIEVASPDHLYCLPACVTHNSEVAFWPNGEIFSEHLDPAFHSADGIYFIESTANGRENFFHTLWKAAEAGKLEYTPVFIPWFVVRGYSKPIAADRNFATTDDEAAIRERVKKDYELEISNEQFNWRRAKIETAIATKGDEWSFHQEFPESPEVAFKVSGQCAFSKRKLQTILNTTCKDPVFVGSCRLEITREGVKTPKFKLRKSSEYLKEPAGKIPVHDHAGDSCPLWIWELPEEGRSYYISADVAMGNADGDYSTVQINKIGVGKQPDEQVAEWRGHMNPTPFAHVIYALARYYNNAEVAVECNADVGTMCNNELRLNLEYEQIFQWKRYDRVSKFNTDYVGWYTNNSTRPQIITRLREAVDESTLIIRSKDLIEEMMAFASVKGGRFEGQSCKDDLVMAMCICYWCTHDSDWGQAQAQQVPGPATGFVCTVEPLHRWKTRADCMASGGKEFPLKDRRILDSVGVLCPECAKLQPEVRSEIRWIAPPDFQNTTFSPIHDRKGLRRDMYLAGTPASQITLDSVTTSTPPTNDDLWKTL